MRPTNNQSVNVVRWDPEMGGVSVEWLMVAGASIGAALIVVGIYTGVIADLGNLFIQTFCEKDSHTGQCI